MFRVLAAGIIGYLITVVSLSALPLEDITRKIHANKSAFHVLEVDADSVHSFDALHIDAQFQIDLENLLFFAEVALQAAVMDSSLETLPLHLNDCIVDSIFIDGETAEFALRNQELQITLPEAASIGDTLTAVVHYHRFLRTVDEAGGMIYNRPSDVLYTFGEPYATRNWLACYDLPFDKVTSVLTVTMDSSYKVLSNGEPGGIEYIDDGLSRTVWINNDPISTYLISIAAHPYLVIDGGTAGENNTEYHYWIYPEDSAAAMQDLRLTGQMIEFFETLFGVYPFNKYDQAVTALFACMEHQTATTLSEEMIGGRQAGEIVVAHELAHQWWGDMVGPLTFKDIWLNEGFATYGQWLWYGRNIRERLHEGLDLSRLYYFFEDGRIRYALYDPPREYLFGTAVYHKGGWVLHMLRGLIGDDNFFEGLITYGRRYAYGSATTPEFQQVMEEVSGMELADFFDQWIYQAGYPIYNFNRFEITGSEVDGYSAVIDVEQSQVRAPIFTTPLPLRLYGGGHDTLLRVELVEQVSQTLTVSGLSFAPVGFEFDPDGWILCVSNMNVSAGQLEPDVPQSFVLYPAFPNPFNSSTQISYSLPAETWVEIDIFDGTGREVNTLTDQFMQAGYHSTAWHGVDSNGAPDPSGVYFFHIRAGEFSGMRKICMIR